MKRFKQVTQAVDFHNKITGNNGGCSTFVAQSSPLSTLEFNICISGCIQCKMDTGCLLSLVGS